MTAPAQHDDDPQHDAESLVSAPQTAAESARAKELASLFGAPQDEVVQRSEAEEAARRDSLAALFARPANAAAAAAQPAFTWDPEAVVGPQKADAASVGAAGVRAAVAGHGTDVPESEPDLHEIDPLAWLGFTDDAASGTVAEADGAASASRVSAARASWLDIIGGGSRTTTALPAAVAARAMAEPTAGLRATSKAAPAGSFPSTEQRGIRGWSARVRWSVAVSIVLLIGVVLGSVTIAQTVAADNLADNVAAQELAAAVADLEAAEESAADPQPVLDEAVTQYEDTVAIAQATADSAAPPLAAVAGMDAQPALDASNAALAALVAQLAAAPPADLPELYERGDIDMGDIDMGDIDMGDIEAVKAATTITSGSSRHRPAKCAPRRPRCRRSSTHCAPRR